MIQRSLSIDQVLGVLDTLPTPRHYWVAYSGGMDSSVLLSLMCAHRNRLQAEVAAVHVNHQLSANAGQWEKHCRAVCRENNIRYESVAINVRDGYKDSPEARARALRYAALEKYIEQNDILLTAHHRDDLAETVMLQMLRGSGPEGLAAMPVVRRFGKGSLVRPLLAFTRQQIEIYAIEQQLIWVEDESNSDQGIDRNYIRNTIMPALKRRWPSTADVLWRVARVQADAAAILNDMAAQDLHQVAGPGGDRLRLSEMSMLASPRQKNLLRYWIRKNGHPAPPMTVIDEVMTELMQSRPDSMPCVKWAGAEIRRYRDDVYIMPVAGDTTAAPEPRHWQLEKPLPLDGRCLTARLITGGGIRADRVQDKTVQVCLRTGGERIRPAGRRETHELKKLFQDIALPPWQRDRIPLIYVRNELAAVIGYWIAEGFQATGSEQGWEIVFTDTL